MTKRRDECFKCRKRKCHYRIYTEDGTFDEVACAEHGNDMERHADAVLNKAWRHHVLGTSQKRRGDEPLSTQRHIRLEQANRIIGFIGIGRGKLILKNGRVAVEYESYRKPGVIVSKTWMTKRGSDFWPTFDGGTIGWGGTVTQSVAQLVRWVNGKTVLPLCTWEYWCSKTVQITEQSADLLSYLREIGWPVEVPCVICGAALGAKSLDWWSYIHHGPCCWGAPSRCAYRNERDWDYHTAKWKQRSR